MLKMRMVYVCVNSEQSFENDLHNIQEVLGKGDSNLTGKEIFIIELVLYPGHQKVDVLAG